VDGNNQVRVYQKHCDACNQFVTMADWRTAIMTEAEHHHRRRRRHRHHHPHHPHSGTTPAMQTSASQGRRDRLPSNLRGNPELAEAGDEEFPIHVHEAGQTVMNDQRVTNLDQRAYHSHAAAQGSAGGFNDALRRVLEAVNSMAGNTLRQRLMGYAVARLIEQGRIGGIADVVSVALAEVNHYAHVSEDIPRQSNTTTKGWHIGK
jgi:hypothetical protein